MTPHGSNTKRVIFKENPHIATINAHQFNPDLHEDIDWREDPKRARRFLKENGANEEALNGHAAMVPAFVEDVTGAGDQGSSEAHNLAKSGSSPEPATTPEQSSEKQAQSAASRKKNGGR